MYVSCLVWIAQVDTSIETDLYSRGVDLDWMASSDDEALAWPGVFRLVYQSKPRLLLGLACLDFVLGLACFIFLAWSGLLRLIYHSKTDRSLLGLDWLG